MILTELGHVKLAESMFVNDFRLAWGNFTNWGWLE